MTASSLEREFETRRLQLLADWPAPKREFEFNKPQSKHALDFYWPAYRVAVEMEGVFGRRKSRHTTPMGYTNDCTKYNLAIERGIKVLRYTKWHISNDPVSMFEQIRRVLEQEREGM